MGFEWSVDCGSPADITTIQIAGAPGVDTIPGDVTVDCRWSDDGATWTVVGPLLVHPDDATRQILTFPSAGAHRHWGFIVTGYDIPGHGSNASFSEAQGCKPPPPPMPRSRPMRRKLPLPQLSVR